MAVMDTELEKRVFARIEELEDELIKVAIDLGNIDTTHLTNVDEYGNTVRTRDIRAHEKVGGEYVFNWLTSNGFEVKRIGSPDRPNVLGMYRGTGNGRSLLFNSHLDVGMRDGMEWRTLEPDAPHKIAAWRDGDDLVGAGICNCKGPMACWLIAAKAIKDLDIRLPGDLLLLAVVGETGGSPVDEYESPKWDFHELGARYTASHGATADYSLCAEATGFTVVLAMTGFAYFRITVHAGPSTYTPFLRRPEQSLDTSVNAVVRMAKFIEGFEKYADDYSKKSTVVVDGSTMVPNATIGAIRAGVPPWPGSSAELCTIYCDFRIAPGQNPLDIQRDIEGIMSDTGNKGKVEMYKFLPGYQGKANAGFDTFKQALVNAHSRQFDGPPDPAPTQFVSMWRDLNPYNEIGVPSISSGIPQIKPTFLDIAPSGIPSNIIPHSKGVKCGLIRSNSPFSYSNHRPAKPKIPKPLVYAQVSPLGTSFATP